MLTIVQHEFFLLKNLKVVGEQDHTQRCIFYFNNH